MAAAWRYSVDGREISEELSPWLHSLSVTDRVGFEADRCELVLTAMPDVAVGSLRAWAGALVRPAIGDEERGAVELGSFTVDTLDLSGPPERTRVTARSVAGATRGDIELLRSSIPSTDGLGLTTGTVGEVVAAWSEELGLGAPDIAAAAVDQVLGFRSWLGQTYGEGLRSLAKTWGTSLQVFDGRIRMPDLTASRGTATLRPEQVSRWGVSAPAGQEMPRVSVYWVLPYTELHGGAPGEEMVESYGSGSPARIIRYMYEGKAITTKAQAAAIARSVARQSRRAITFRAGLPGDPDLQPGVALTLEGWPEVVPAAWRIVEAAHRLDADRRYTTRLIAEEPDLG